MIKVLNVESQTRIPVAEGNVRTILGPARRRNQGSGGDRGSRSGQDVPLWLSATGHRSPISWTGKTRPSPTRLLERLPNTQPSDAPASTWSPGKKPPVTAAGTPLAAAAHHRAEAHRQADRQRLAGRLFLRGRRNSDRWSTRKRFRERTFWVNKETSLSGSWDLQLGRMAYAPHAHSPRHVHHAAKTNPIIPEHFYLIEKGTGEVKHDTGSLPVGPAAWSSSLPANGIS